MSRLVLRTVRQGACLAWYCVLRTVWQRACGQSRQQPAVCLRKSSVEMWWHTRRNQISSFARNGPVHLNRSGGGRQFSRLLEAEVCGISGSNAGYTVLRGSVKGTGYPLHSPVSPFTSPPVRHRVPSHFNWALPSSVLTESVYPLQTAGITPYILASCTIGSDALSPSYPFRYRFGGMGVWGLAGKWRRFLTK